MRKPTTESEIKIPVDDLDPVRENLVQNDGVRIHPSLREDNLLLDTADSKLRSTGKVLRLRHVGDESILTLKGPASFLGPVKQRTEYEVRVDDTELLRKIFEGLGFEIVARYQKDREAWRFDESTIVLDHTPMGDFVEVEGPPSILEEVARRIGLDPANAVEGSYPRLWLEYREDHRAENLPTDMVFLR